MDDAAERRSSRRQNASRAAKNSETFEKLRQLKGKKHKYELVEEKPVYDVVDEAHYARIVLDRQKNDWIVDDATGGYCEDGREIFDDDSSSEEEGHEIGSQAQKRKMKQKIRRGHANGQPDGEKDDEADEEQNGVKSRNIAAMFKDLQAKNPRKKIREVEHKDEDLLTNILNQDFGCSQLPAPKPINVVPSSQRVQLQKKQQSVPKPKPLARKTLEQVKRGVEEALDIEGLDDVLQPPLKKTNSSAADRFYTKPEPDLKPAIQMSGKVAAPAGESCLQDCDADFQNYCNDDVDNDSPDESSEPITLSEDAELEYEYFTDPVTNAKYLKFYWIDVHEVHTMPGTVFVFGKIFAKSAGCFVNTCVTVRDIAKQLFFLMKCQETGSEFAEKAEEEKVLQEIRDLAKKLKITKFKTKIVRKNYAFDRQGVPDQGKYVEVHVPAGISIPAEYQSGKHYSCVFGTNQSSLERLVLDRKMKGPGWMRLSNATPNDSAPISWCKTEFTLNSMKDLTVDSENTDPVPPIVLLSIGVKTIVNRSSAMSSEIIAISGFVENRFNLENGTTTSKKAFGSHFCLITKPSQSFQKIFPPDLIPSKIGEQYKRTKVEIANSERELLSLFMARFFRIDPDVIIGHDVVEFDLEMLSQRLAHHKIASWSKLGRLRRSGLPPVKKREKGNLTCGRAVVDIKISARELIKAKSYDLTELAHQMLREIRRDFDQEVILSAYDRLEDFFRLIGWIMKDNQLAYRMLMELNVLPLALQITKIAGNSFSRTLLGGRSERNEFLLLHAFHDANYICPDKSSYKEKNKWTTTSDVRKKNTDDPEKEDDKSSSLNKKKAAYAGGLVLDPKVGYYTDYVLILDFNSLYPTIVREFNICFCTINLRQFPASAAGEEESDCLPALPDTDVTQGILPTQITRLVESRREVKKLLQDPKLAKDLKAQLNIKQMALKLTANSMYGCLGFANSRFYAKPLAALITSKGREILMKTKTLVEEMSLEVIYGDTDSIMINTGSKSLEDAVKISNRVQASVNGMHKYLEIECDGILKFMLLLKKKKYAALVVKRTADNSVTYEKEMKGLDIVRRDWSVIAKTAGEAVVNEILHDPSIDIPIQTVVDNIHQYLRDTAERIRSQADSKSKQFIQQFVISKQLTKNPEDYPDKKNLSHVSVALAFNSKTDKKLRAGDVVPYIICSRVSNTDNFNALPATQRAFHPSEVLSDEDLRVDVTYYLEQQIHPVVSRLIDPLPGTDGRTVAEFLGLDESFCPIRTVDQVTELVEAGKHKFDTCKSLLLNCPRAECGQQIELREPFQKDLPDVWSLDKCPHCNILLTNQTNGKRIEKMVMLRVKDVMDQYYAFSYTCGGKATCCKQISFCPSLRVGRKGVECPECQSEMFADLPAKKFYTQLQFFENIFDFKTEEEKKREKEEKKKEIEIAIPKCYSLRENLLMYVRKIRQTTRYNDVDLTNIFSGQEFTFF